MDLAVNEEFTRMYSEEELMGARRIQARRWSPCWCCVVLSILPRYDSSRSPAGVFLVAKNIQHFVWRFRVFTLRVEVFGFVRSTRPALRRRFEHSSCGCQVSAGCDS